MPWIEDVIIASLMKTHVLLIDPESVSIGFSQTSNVDWTHHTSIQYMANAKFTITAKRKQSIYAKLINR